jgi:hypothetical protein
MTDEVTPSVTPADEPTHIHVPRPSRQRDAVRLETIFELGVPRLEEVDEAAA